MKIVIFGAGYVGSVTAACLAKLGHSVMVVDPVVSKIETIRQGRSPILEPDLDQLISEGVTAGRLQADSDFSSSILAADAALVCVGTPSRSSGLVDTGALRRVLQSINAAIPRRGRLLTVIIRSTILAPVLKNILAEIQTTTEGLHFQPVLNPEFLRETTAVADFFRPPFIIVGGTDEKAMDHALEIYQGIDVPRHKVTLETASLFKYACNAFHALKISFANEIDTLASLIGANGREVMSLLTKDTILNISPAYLRPGFAFGGSCLPKDLRALEALGREHHEPLPLLSSVLPSNRRRIDQALEIIVSQAGRRLAFIGLSFKSGSDDLRESPFVEVAERLLGKGFQVTIYDPDLDPSRLVGANMAHAMQHLPHLARILVASPEAACREADAIILCKPILNRETLQQLSAHGKQLFNLQQMAPSAVAKV